MALVIDRQIFGDGTSENDWLECAALNALPTIAANDLVPTGRSLIVCAPHPDDEILPCGGLLCALSELGIKIKILAITDGEASHGDGSFDTQEMLRQIRPQESAAALRRLGFPGTIERLGFPDGGLQGNRKDLIEAIRQHVQAGDVLLTPWELDGHPDHEVVWEAAHVVAQEMRCEHVETPIWGWHWSHPSATPMPWQRGLRVLLTPLQMQRKEAAIREFKSQLEVIDDRPAILSETTLARFRRPWEVYFR